jgi:serine/threonine protein kinase
MPLQPSDKLGPYEILLPIGSGGMGEVWKARDTRLLRTVAIKILPERIAKREDLRARFEREARAVASLNHPNICTLFDIGSQDGVGAYMVMECLEGETLAARIAKGALPLDQALSLAAQIADALDRAHRAGVAHRDIKPANIMLTRDGVKLLDFGLAKSLAPKPGPSEETLTQALTAEGTVMGTPQYMSPEQFEGREADARSDVWAFGAVLYEMVTGQKAFQGKNYPSLVGAILSADPAPMSVHPFTPAWLERLVRRCLAKDPEDRWQSMRDVVIELRSPPQESSSTRSKTSRWPWAVAAVAISLAIALAFLHFRELPPERPVLQYTLTPPTTNFVDVAVSPDGRYLVFDSAAETGPRLWVRSLDSLQVHSLPGTENATRPFWSPDSRYIAFFAQDKLLKIPVNGGPVQTVCDAPTARGGAWGGDNVIVFAPFNGNKGLSRVSSGGGMPVPLTRNEDGRGTHRWPIFLPDGRRFLYVATTPANGGKDDGIRLASLDNSNERRLVPDESIPGYQPPSPGNPLGYLLFVRQGTLIAQPVDPRSLESKGDPFPVTEQVSRGVSSGKYLFSVAPNGLLVFRPGGSYGNTQHVWFDRSGKELGTVGGKVPSGGSMALSPDGKRVVIENRGGQNSDLWIVDLEHGGAEARLTFDENYNGQPVWSPDGGKIAFRRSNGGIGQIYQRSSSGTGQEERLDDSKDSKVATDWSRDGRFLIFSSRGEKTNLDLWALPMTGFLKPAERKPILLVQTQYAESQGQLSPDGRWLAYTSFESGRSQVYVQPFAPGWNQPTAGKWQISTAGGSSPRWRGDGKELFFLSTDDRKLKAVEVKASAQAFAWGAPQVLFESRTVFSPTNFPYAVTADGQRFLMAVPAGEPDTTPSLTVVLNWLAWAKR